MILSERVKQLNRIYNSAPSQLELVARRIEAFKKGKKLPEKKKEEKKEDNSFAKRIGLPDPYTGHQAAIDKAKKEREADEAAKKKKAEYKEKAAKATSPVMKQFWEDQAEKATAVHGPVIIPADREEREETPAGRKSNTTALKATAPLSNVGKSSGLARNYIEKSHPFGTKEGIQSSFDFGWAYLNPFKPLPDDIPAKTENEKTRRALEYIKAGKPVPEEYKHTLTEGETYRDPITLEVSEKPIKFYTPTDKSMTKKISDAVSGTTLDVNYNDPEDIKAKRQWAAAHTDSLLHESTFQNLLNVRMDGTKADEGEAYLTTSRLNEAMNLMQTPATGAWQRTHRAGGNHALDFSSYILPEGQEENSTTVPHSYAVDKWRTSAGSVIPTLEPLALTRFFTGAKKDDAITVVPVNTKGKFKAVVSPEQKAHADEILKKWQNGEIPQEGVPENIQQIYIDLFKRKPANNTNFDDNDSLSDDTSAYTNEPSDANYNMNIDKYNTDLANIFKIPAKSVNNLKNKNNLINLHVPKDFKIDPKRNKLPTNPSNTLSIP